MSSIIDREHQSALAMQPIRGILKSSKSIDETRSDQPYQFCSMRRSESRSSKIPRFDETNIIATHHPENKDYGRMKIIEPLNSFNPNPMINEEIDGVEQTRAEKPSVDVNPKKLSDGLTDNNISENRPRFQTYKNEFEVVRLHRHEIEAELRALEQEDEQSTKP